MKDILVKESGRILIYLSRRAVQEAPNSTAFTGEEEGAMIPCSPLKQILLETSLHSIPTLPPKAVCKSCPFTSKTASWFCSHAGNLMWCGANRLPSSLLNRFFTG